MKNTRKEGRNGFLVPRIPRILRFPFLAGSNLLRNHAESEPPDVGGYRMNGRLRNLARRRHGVL
jgi:hypothetical protein